MTNLACSFNAVGFTEALTQIRLHYLEVDSSFFDSIFAGYSQQILGLMYIKETATATTTTTMIIMIIIIIMPKQAGG